VCSVGVGGIRGDCGEVGEFAAQWVELGTVAGNADDACAGCREGSGDAAAESATGACDDRRGAGQRVVGLVHIESDTHHGRDSSVHPR